MRTIILTIVLVTLAILVGSAIQNDPGFVSISIAEQTLETSLAFLVFAALIIFTLLFLALKIALFLYHLPEQISAFRKRQKGVKARRNLTQGLIDLAEGKWGASEKKLIKFAQYSDATLINYLAAARAAQHQKAHGRRDAYLKKAIEENPEADIAVGITQAELQISHNQIEQALATLNWLQKLSPKHIYIKKLLARIYIKLNDTQKFIELIPDLKKYKLISEEKINKLEVKAYIKGINHISDSPKQVIDLWQKTPKNLKANRNILFHYCQKLLALNEVQELTSCIESEIQETWDERIILIFGMIDGEGTTARLNFAESLLAEHDQNAALYLTLGRLCIKRELWGKAKSYFDQSLNFGGTTEAFLALAQLHEQLGEIEDANKNYKKGLVLAKEHLNN